MTNPKTRTGVGAVLARDRQHRDQTDVGRDAVDLQMREECRLQHDAHEHDEAEADATDHGIATGDLQHLDEGERVEVDDGTQLGVASDGAARVDAAHDGTDHQSARDTSMSLESTERDRDVALLRHARASGCCRSPRTGASCCRR